MKQSIINNEKIRSVLNQKFSKKLKSQLHLKIEKYSDGSIRKACFCYCNYMIAGEFKSFFRNGNLKEHCFYERGAQCGLYTSFHSNGQLKESYFNDPYHGKDGEYRRFTKNGQLIERCFYKEGELDGEYILYFFGGKVAEKYNYKNGLIHGLCQEYYHENGKLSRHCFYVDDEFHGRCIFYSSFKNKYEVQYYFHGTLMTQNNFESLEVEDNILQYNHNFSLN